VTLLSDWFPVLLPVTVKLDINSLIGPGYDRHSDNVDIFLVLVELLLTHL